jgi:C-terminal processing protease CtpA/Prc
MEFDLHAGGSWGAGSPVARVLYVYDDSPAGRAAIKRTDWFDRVNGHVMGDWKTNTNWWYWNRVIDTLVNPIEGLSVTVGMREFVQYQGGRLDPGEEKTLMPERKKFSPILMAQAYTLEKPAVEGEPVQQFNTGYLAYTNFDQSYATELREAFSSFRMAAVKSVILDLRYSRAGSVENALTMANLIVPPAAQGKIFAKYEFKGTGSADRSTEALFDPASESSNVGVETVYILTSALTAGPAELLINALKGVEESAGIKLIVIGDKTEGMNVGQVRHVVSTDRYDYTLHIVAFRCYNDLGKGSYEYGFIPNGGTIKEWDRNNILLWGVWGWKTQQNATQDPLLRQAVDYIMGDIDPPAASVLEGTSLVQNSAYPRKYSVPTTMTMEVAPYVPAQP